MVLSKDKGMRGERKNMTNGYTGDIILMILKMEHRSVVI